MKRSRLLFGLVALAILNACASAQSETADPSVTAKLSGTAFITTKLDSSVSFYTSVLGFKERGRRSLTSDAATSVFGVPSGTELDYVVLVPAEFSDTNTNFPGLNFVGLPEADSLDLPQFADRGPKDGELVFAFEVTDMGTIYQRVIAGGIPIVTDRALSATGKSETLTILDPNGIRVQLYEYIDLPEN